MSQFSEAQRTELREEIGRQLRDFGSLFSVGLPAAPALATPTGFGLTEVEFTEGAPKAFQASAIVRKIRTADVANNTGVFVSAGLSIPVLTGQSWILTGALYIGSAAVTGGLNLRVIIPAVGQSRLAVFGPRNAGAFGYSVAAASVTSGVLCNFDCSANDAFVFVQASFDALAGDGTLDLQFLNAVGGENWILRRNSWVTAVRTL